ncbi:MAG: hypothetical protein O6944_03685 [Gammaproteobacteria bacterium]|nr:hypothetical protein [Gammaproteobacteria bacterium]
MHDTIRRGKHSQDFLQAADGVEILSQKGKVLTDMCDKPWTHPSSASVCPDIATVRVSGVFKVSYQSDTIETGHQVTRLGSNSWLETRV